MNRELALDQATQDFDHNQLGASQPHNYDQSQISPN